MDTNTAVGLLLKHFESKDSFNIDVDYEKLDWKLLGEDNSSTDEKRAAILTGLQLMEKENMLSKVENSKKSFTYVITSSRQNQPISIELEKDTAINIVNIVNQFLPIMDINNTQKSTLDRIGEAEIIVLLKAIGFLAQQVQSKLESEDKPEK